MAPPAPPASEASATVAARDPNSGSTTTAAQVAEDLEEAEFYFKQELYDEAEAIYRRILSVAPNHPSALLRMGEMAVARGGDASDSTAAPASEAAAGRASAATPGPETETEPVIVDDAAPAGIDTGEPDEGEFVFADASSDADEQATEDDASTGLDSPTLVDAEVPEEFCDVGEPPETVSNADDEGAGLSLDDDHEEDEGFDLAAELSDSLDDDPDARQPDNMVLSDVERLGVDLQRLRRASASSSTRTTSRTRYGLGIAYMEMGLHQDAIAEFQLCLQSDARRLNSLHMMGLCALNLGRPQDATNHLEQALSQPHVPDEERPGLYFDLGRAFQQAGEIDRARDAYETVRTNEPSFPGIDQQIASLDAEADGSNDDAGDGEVFESFDDFLSDIEADNQAVEGSGEAAQTESFDDLIAEAEAGDDVEPAAEAEVELEPEAELVSEPDPGRLGERRAAEEEDLFRLRGSAWSICSTSA